MNKRSRIWTFLEVKMAQKLVPTKPGQKHKGNWFPMITRNHIIALGLHNQMSRKCFFYESIFKRWCLDISSVNSLSFPTGMSDPWGEENMVAPLMSLRCVCKLHYVASVTIPVLNQDLHSDEDCPGTGVVWVLYNNYFWFFSFQKDGMITLSTPWTWSLAMWLALSSEMSMKVWKVTSE